MHGVPVRYMLEEREREREGWRRNEVGTKAYRFALFCEMPRNFCSVPCDGIVFCCLIDSFRGRVHII
ncbi:unnamed protein product [Musa hybrid cultivar]